MRPIKEIVKYQIQLLWISLINVLTLIIYVIFGIDILIIYMWIAMILIQLSLLFRGMRKEIEWEMKKWELEIKSWLEIRRKL